MCPPATNMDPLDCGLHRRLLDALAASARALDGNESRANGDELQLLGMPPCRRADTARAAETAHQLADILDEAEGNDWRIVSAESTRHASQSHSNTSRGRARAMPRSCTRWQAMPEMDTTWTRCRQSCALSRKARAGKCSSSQTQRAPLVRPLRRTVGAPPANIGPSGWPLVDELLHQLASSVLQLGQCSDETATRAVVDAVAAWADAFDNSHRACHSRSPRMLSDPSV